MWNRLKRINITKGALLILRPIKRQSLKTLVPSLTQYLNEPINIVWKILLVVTRRDTFLWPFSRTWTLWVHLSVWVLVHFFRFDSYPMALTLFSLRMVLSGKIDEQLENVGNFCKNLCMFSSKIRLFWSCNHIIQDVLSTIYHLSYVRAKL